MSFANSHVHTLTFCVVFKLPYIFFYAYPHLLCRLQISMFIPSPSVLFSNCHMHTLTFCSFADIHVHTLTFCVVCKLLCAASGLTSKPTPIHHSPDLKTWAPLRITSTPLIGAYERVSQNPMNKVYIRILGRDITE